MKEVGWRLCCLLALHLVLVLAQEPSNDLKTDDQPVDNIEGSRSGAVSDSVESSEKDANLEAEEVPKLSDDGNVLESETKRFLLGNLKDDLPLNNLRYPPQGQIYNQHSPLDQSFPEHNEYKHDPQNVQNANQILTYNGIPPSSEGISANQVVVSGSQNNGLQSPRSGNDDEDNLESPEAYSRVIPYSERILLHTIPGASNLISCTREGELHNFWSSSYQCLVCACIKDTEVLRAVCASCAGCMASRPVPVEVEWTTPERPSFPERPVTVLPQIEDEVTCRPLPSGQPFDNPLHPCQVCICIETVNSYGKPDVQITCQENPQCVLPTDVTVIPAIPDVPVPSPYCDKFPLNVVFPHPSDSCKTCQCSEQVSQRGLLEKLITCLPNPDCSPEPEIITEPPDSYLVTPSYPVPVEPLVPVYEPEPPQPSWTPATVPPSHLGPLPGPSPHDSCRPYIPNQPFQHPWDECQMCVCTEASAKKHVTVEISCFTKKSCCVEPPFDVITPATLPPAPYQPPGKLKFQDAICEYKTFGVEFTHPKDPCNICTCELQGRLITPLCKRSPKPECQLIATYPTVPLNLAEVIQENTRLPSQGSISSYNAGSSSSQNKAIKNAFVSYQNPYGSGGLQLGSTQSSADQSSYNQWNHQNYQRPGDLSFKSQNGQNPQLGSQNFRPGETSLVYGQNQRPGNSQLGYGAQYGNVQGLGSSYYTGQGYQGNGGPYGQSYYPGAGSANAYGQGYPGYQISQAQTKASASASASAATGLQSNTYGYTPGYGYQGQGYPGLKTTGKIRQFAQTSASAQSIAQSSSIKFKGRSGNPDETEPEKEN